MRALENAGIRTIEHLQQLSFNELVKVPMIGYKTAYSLKAYLGQSIDYDHMISASNQLMEEPIIIENKVIKSWAEYKKTTPFQLQPNDFKLQKTTVWSFPDRGNWATHTPQYRGNWSPYVARNVISRYSQPGDLVLDPMVGGGTTPVECLLLNRNSISVDINPGAIKITNDRLKLPEKCYEQLEKTDHQTFVGDVRNLNSISNESIDLIATHPPYVNIIRYAPKHEGDLSLINDYEIFFQEFRKGIMEMWRVLKPGKYCCVLIGDTHNRGHFVPISSRMLKEFLECEFKLKEDIIKIEWNCESDRKLNKYSNSDFLLTMHEHLFVFRKPNRGEKETEFRNSSKAFY